MHIGTNTYKCCNCHREIKKTEINNKGQAKCSGCGVICYPTIIPVDNSTEVSAQGLRCLKVNETENNLIISWTGEAVTVDIISSSVWLVLMLGLTLLICMSMISDIRLFRIMGDTLLMFPIIVKFFLAAIPGYVCFLCVKSIICLKHNTSFIEVNENEIRFYFGPYWSRNKSFRLCNVNKVICHLYEEERIIENEKEKRSIRKSNLNYRETWNKRFIRITSYNALSVLFKHGGSEQIYGRDDTEKVMFMENTINRFLEKRKNI